MQQDYLRPSDVYAAASARRERNHYSYAPVKAALFDMDGTLYDSMPLHASAWHRLLTELDIPHSLDEIYLYEGMTGAATINLLFNRHYGRNATPEECQRYYEAKTRYFNQLPTAATMPAASEVLNYLASAGLTIILVTGSGQASLIDRLNNDFPGIFDRDRMVTSANVTHGKPHPEPYQRGAALAGVAPAQCIAVENAPLGVESASRAGAFTIGLTTGPIPANQLAEAGADLVLPSMQSLADNIEIILNSLNQQ